LINRQLL